jgi:alpha-glucosidase
MSSSNRDAWAPWSVTLSSESRELPVQDVSQDTVAPRSPWWRNAVIYQVYIRSFADGNGDGVGDIAGIRARLPYLRDLGVDAIWITPWYPSPMADAGYDVADYRDIDPAFGDLAAAQALVREAQEQGLRVVLDIVPNHTSDQHAWFRQAVAAGPGSPERQRYIFRPGRGPGGGLPPNNWCSFFGCSAWTRVVEPDGTPGEWYLHLFAPEQPDLNWDNAGVHAEFESILRFWLHLGIDGFRVDAAPGLIKHPDLPDVGAEQRRVLAAPNLPDHPHWDRDGVHDIFQEWRRVAESYGGERIFIAEAGVASPERLAGYTAPGRLHTAFNFDFLECAWDAVELREIVDATLDAHAAVGAPPTWVLSNHDTIRHVTRYGRAETSPEASARLYGSPVDLDLGTRRARAAALLMLALPGGAYIYQGEELGLWEVEDLPEEVLQDPAWERSGRTVRGRDGCRVPLPWSGAEPPFGFSLAPASAQPWLPHPPAWKDHTAEAQTGDPGSTLELYRAALRIRREHPALGDGTLGWLDSPEGTLLFARDPGFVCAVNLSADPLGLPPNAEVLLATGPLEGDSLGQNTAAWLSELSVTSSFEASRTAGFRPVWS